MDRRKPVLSGPALVSKQNLLWKSTTEGALVNLYTGFLSPEMEQFKSRITHTWRNAIHHPPWNAYSRTPKTNLSANCIKILKWLVSRPHSQHLLHFLFAQNNLLRTHLEAERPLSQVGDWHHEIHRLCNVFFLSQTSNKGSQMPIVHLIPFLVSEAPDYLNCNLGPN